MAEESKISKAQQKAVNKYISNNYDRINLTVPKGKKTDISKKKEERIFGKRISKNRKEGPWVVISINETSEVPIYQQIRNQIVLGISDGRLKPGEQLPTVRALAGEIGINSMTVNKAYVLLKQEGYIYTDRRNGAHVRKEFSEAKELSEKSKELLQQIISEAKICGMTQEEFLKICENMYKG